IKKIAKKFLSKEEIEKTKDISLITLWCVKEAVAKALGTGFVFSPKDIFIQNIDGEKFKIKLKGEFLSLFPEFENKGIEVKTFKKYNYIFAFCNIGDNTHTFHLKK
ncbi:MAG: 4'-phosphopantetheinyl transferase superfamily protein, partial [Candidatus Omnitrophota bacterium]